MSDIKELEELTEEIFGEDEEERPEEVNEFLDALDTIREHKEDE
jgi:hypothetical protein